MLLGQRLSPSPVPPAAVRRPGHHAAVDVPDGNLRRHTGPESVQRHHGCSLQRARMASVHWRSLHSRRLRAPGGHGTIASSLWQRRSEAQWRSCNPDGSDQSPASAADRLRQRVQWRPPSISFLIALRSPTSAALCIDGRNMPSSHPIGISNCTAFVRPMPELSRERVKQERARSARNPQIARRLQRSLERWREKGCGSDGRGDG